YRPGQEGLARVAHLHPHPRDRKVVCRQGRTGIGSASLPDRRAPARGRRMNTGVLATLAAIALLGMAAFLWRDALLRLFGYELAPTRPQLTAHEELRGTMAVLHR